MKKITLGLRASGFLVLLLMLLPASSQALDMGLVSTLVNKLGITEKQAEGGSGVIFEMAKKRMPESDYKQLSESVPEVEMLQSAAPAPVEKKGLFGSATSMLGEKTGSSLSDGAGLMSSFKKLGMDSEMLSKFTPVVYAYVKEKGGAAVSGMLQKALSF